MTMKSDEPKLVEKSPLYAHHTSNYLHIHPQTRSSRTRNQRFWQSLAVRLGTCFATSFQYCPPCCCCRRASTFICAKEIRVV